MAGLAARTERLRLGTLVVRTPTDHPAVLANIAAAMDHISGGRLVLGLGAGWQVNEHAAYGIPLFSVKERLDRFEEACHVVNGLFREQRFTFHGSYYDITDAPNDPKPVQARLPLLVGGGGEKRTLRIAAEHADEWNVWGSPEILRHKIGVLGQHCATIGRDPAEIRHSANALLFLSDDEEWLVSKRGSDTGRADAVIIGTPAEVVEIVESYIEAGVSERLDVDHDAALAVRHLQRGVADLARLLLEDRADELLLGGKLGLALGRDLADEQVARPDLGADADDAAVVEVASVPPSGWGCRG